ncbi:substrate-binding periplasmic protein [Ketogulonicigenium vulgare]|uniref:Extracellular solute-binding protein, family 3 n=1 Tax=Ketogulonicigenium vulgare (strain WSH-001) TaxID=759362 RepID=F9Y432_KETVW|nr:transporter substrate-binding domain-containing protein [Ketogulonicigenium vulgare]ADO42270.1 extracellular solute-binding protein [Ketogulonicigenium vulgare Y25]AEM40468.1 Extracellular solute-binding protein, family 3 [Ketogulonicigenium vulgare WSH-001]ALJ80653.1 ABC transporter substrate-binding protein [Ketogulonicigenium vulgare]ANW33467.1 ABC transporter substrate-binding protein [Ketogulonicigenium vulgare]AOZ54184.1 extracellular solute-binding protein [Ketogulonicigenium vulgare
MFFRRHARDLGAIAAVLMLFSAVNLLPPDTALKQVERQGVLRVCAPQNYPPFVTADPAAPGIEVEIIRTIAQGMGLRLSINRIAAIGREVNPLAWNISRANCHVMIGGLVDTPLMRNYMDMSPPYLQSGWVTLAATDTPDVSGARIGVFVGTIGRDRLALSRALREAGAAEITGQTSLNGAVRALAAGDLDLIVTDAVLASGVAHEDLRIAPLGALPGDSIGMGFWKGDLTLKRAALRILDQMIDSGETVQIAARYGYGTLAELAAEDSE